MSTLVASDTLLTESDVRSRVQSSLASLDLDGKRVLLIIPDDTRTSPIGLMLRSIAEFANDRVEVIDVMIALGTHRPMSDDRINQLLGIDESDRQTVFPRTRFFNHAWDDPTQLRVIGTIDSDTMKALSRGHISDQIDVTINKALFDYDHLIIVGPTFPHEVVGFSGGNKYFFPGVAGPEIINVFHWLGALLTNREIIGTKSTPVRDVVDHCAAMINRPKHCFSMVVSKQGLHGLEFGTPESAYQEAAALSAEVNIRWMPARLSHRRLGLSADVSRAVDSRQVHVQARTHRRSRRNSHHLRPPSCRGLTHPRPMDRGDRLPRPPLLHRADWRNSHTSPSASSPTPPTSRAEAGTRTVSRPPMSTSSSPPPSPK